MLTRIYLLCGLAGLLLSSTTARATELRIFSLPGLSDVMADLGPRFAADTGNKLITRYGTLAQAHEVVSTADYDLMIYASPFIRELIRAGKLMPDKPIVISHVKIGVAVKAGAPKPPLGNAEQFKQALLSAKSISYTKDSPAGFYLSGLMDRLGISAQVGRKTKLLGGGGQNPKAVAAGDVELGLSIVPDIVSVPGVELAGTIPDDLSPPDLDFAAGIRKGSDVEAAAQSLLHFLKSPGVEPVFSARGMVQDRAVEGLSQ